MGLKKKIETLNMCIHISPYLEELILGDSGVTENVKRKETTIYTKHSRKLKIIRPQKEETILEKK